MCIALKSYTIPTGTRLFRSADKICDYSKSHIHKNKCTDTGKTGVYFSTYILQSLGMALEYDRNLEMGVFETTAPIKVFRGKYIFRHIHPERHFNPDGSFVEPRVNPIKDENISHIDQTMPIFTFPVIYDRLLKSNEGEVFLTDDNDLKKVKLVETYKFRADELGKFLKHEMKKYKYILLHNNEYYLKSEILKPLDCKKKKNTTRRVRKEK